MSIKIVKTEDAILLAELNKDVQELHHEIEPEIFKPYSKENMEKLFDELLQDENVSAYLAYYNGDVAGYVLLTRKEQDENYFRKSYLVLNVDQICVDGEFKGKGIGKALVDFAKDYARKLKISRIEMNYWTRNNNSGEFFRSQGFENYNERLTFKI